MSKVGGGPSARRIWNYEQRLTTCNMTPVKMYPYEEAPITVTSKNDAYQFGEWVECVPVNTITVDFGVLTAGLAAAFSGRIDVCIEIGIGAAESEVAIMTLPLGEINEVVCIPAIPFYYKVSANTRVAFRTMDISNTATASKHYLVYIEL